VCRRGFFFFQPKKMLPLLVDAARLAAYDTAITAAVAKLQRRLEARTPHRNPKEIPGEL
jgi:hypothetical protein